MSTTLERIKYLAREPMAWWFSTSFATAIVALYATIIGFGALAAILHILVALHFTGLMLGRGRLRFVYHRAKYAPELNARPVVDATE